jgi:hypothetical protein
MVIETFLAGAIGPSSRGNDLAERDGYGRSRGLNRGLKFDRLTRANLAQSYVAFADASFVFVVKIK